MNLALPQLTCEFYILKSLQFAPKYPVYVINTCSSEN